MWFWTQSCLLLATAFLCWGKNPQPAVCFVAPCALQAKQGWMKFCGVEVYLMARLTNLLHLFIFLISLLATAVVTDDCRGLGGGILEFCWFGWWLWTKLIGFFQFMWVQLAVMPTVKAAARQDSMETIYAMSSTLSLYLSVFPCDHLTVICLHLCRDQSLRPLLY